MIFTTYFFKFQDCQKIPYLFVKIWFKSRKVEKLSWKSCKTQKQKEHENHFCRNFYNISCWSKVSQLKLILIFQKQFSLLSLFTARIKTVMTLFSSLKQRNQRKLQSLTIAIKNSGGLKFSPTKKEEERNEKCQRWERHKIKLLFTMPEATLVGQWSTLFMTHRNDEKKDTL